MLFSEIASGGVGTGPYGILVIAMVAVFVGGLLVGRTPEFLGKKLRTREITLAALSILVMPALMLVGTEIAVILPATAGALGNSGDPGTPGVIHGFTEVLYAYASAANNNGSAFGGLTVTNDWFQASLGMHVVRAIPADRLRPRSRRVPGVRATCTRRRRHSAHLGCRVRRTSDRHSRSGGGTDLLPRPCAGPDRGGIALTASTTPLTSPDSRPSDSRTSGARTDRVTAGVFDSRQLASAVPGAFRKLDRATSHAIP